MNNNKSQAFFLKIGGTEHNFSPAVSMVRIRKDLRSLTITNKNT